MLFFPTVFETERLNFSLLDRTPFSRTDWTSLPQSLHTFLDQSFRFASVSEQQKDLQYPLCQVRSNCRFVQWMDYQAHPVLPRVRPPGWLFWNLICSFSWLCTTRFVQMVTLGQQGHIWFFEISNGKRWKTVFFQNNGSLWYGSMYNMNLWECQRSRSFNE